mmetsp:Transcript_20798/g.47216  ORF Transcript_20798/g.47216 Transcript_20798/m.47216 type:complete len:140 (-) Transcript_20798:143-562(-)
MMARCENTNISGSNDHNDQDEESETCPLFMTGLPPNFSSNPALCALASLVKNDDDEKPDEERFHRSGKEPRKNEREMGRHGGGKCTGRDRAGRRGVGRMGTQHTPYAKNNIVKERKASGKISARTTMGEAQLFMKMWKI